MTANWALLAFQIFGFIILLYLMHKMYDRLRPDALPPEAVADGPEAAHLRAGVGDLVRELRQAADEINADMAARASTLQRLVDEANDALKRLDGAAQRPNGPGRHGRPAGAGAGATGKTPGGESSVPQPVPEGVKAPTAAGGSGARRAPASAGRLRADHPTPPHPQAGTRYPSEGPGGAYPAPGEGTRVRPVRPEAEGTRPSADDRPWPGAAAGAPVVQVPRAAAGSPAAASAYRQSAAGFVSVDLADTGKFQAVRRLSDQGLSTTEIARTIGLGREEVELIMRVGGEGAS